MGPNKYGILRLIRIKVNYLLINLPYGIFYNIVWLILILSVELLALFLSSFFSIFFPSVVTFFFTRKQLITTLQRIIISDFLSLGKCAFADVMYFLPICAGTSFSTPVPTLLSSLPGSHAQKRSGVEIAGT